MANVKIVRATYLVIDGTTYKLIDEDVPNWAPSGKESMWSRPL